MFDLKKEMKPHRLSLIAILLGALASLVIGQLTDEENNWYKETNRGDNWYTKFDFGRYSSNDVLIAKEKYLRIVGRRDLNEWEGTYYRPSMLGHAELTWSSDDGFVKAYTYHTLAGLNYGRAIDANEKIRFASEKPVSISGTVPPDEVIKVKFGETHFLIPEEHLRNFAERAAGLTKSPDENDYFWIKTSDENKQVYGLPTYPKRFQHLVRQPIQTKIVSLGKPVLRQDKFETGEVYAQYHDRSITLDAGFDKGLKTGMFLFSNDLDEWIEIVRVRKNRAVGILSRSLSESNQEVCWLNEDARDKARPCVPIRVGIVARTLSQEFNF